MGKNKHLAKGGREVETFVQGASFSGPLPPPSMLTAYNNAVPNAAERILAMAEKQAAHRQNLEERVVKGNIVNQYLGSVFGFILGAIAIGGGIYLIGSGKSITGLAALITPLVGFVAVFFRGRSGQEKERQQKRI